MKKGGAMIPKQIAEFTRVWVIFVKPDVRRSIKWSGQHNADMKTFHDLFKLLLRDSDI